MSRRFRQLSAWDRPSQILLEGLLLVVMVVVVGLTAVTLIGLFTDREVVVPVTLTEQSFGSASGASLATTEGELTLTEATTGQLLISAAPLVLGAAVVTGAASGIGRATVERLPVARRPVQKARSASLAGRARTMSYSRST